MKRTHLRAAAGTAAALLLAALLFNNPPVNPAGETGMLPAFVSDGEGREDREQRARDRDAYFKALLMDPATGEIPLGIRDAELEMAKTLPTREALAKERPDLITNNLDWKEAGPGDVGGRTRALAIDRRNNQIIIAGGVSGGLWKSVNGGQSWSKRTARDGNLSITSVAQDPFNPDHWYASMGELSGNSASDRGFRARYYGSGIYRSTDNGDSWEFLQKASLTHPVSWQSIYQYTSKIRVSPADGRVYLATHAGGILSSGDRGVTFEPVFGTTVNDHLWTDFDFGSDGRMAAALSGGFNATPAQTPGIYVRMNGTSAFTNITPVDFPTTAGRTVLAFAPSNANVFYAMVLAGDLNDSEDDIRLYRFDFIGGSWTASNRTAGLPAFGGPAGFLNAQGDYNMVIAVKPDDENFVIFGLTNLYRSRNGFSTASPASAEGRTEGWIGGYTNAGNSFANYPQHHADQHALVFDPANPNVLWSGHDGGISVTADVSISGSSVAWTRRNANYHVTQFYTASISRSSTSNFVGGGTQDNGTRYFAFSTNPASTSSDVSSGDGSYLDIGTRYLYSSSQNGVLSQFNFASGRWTSGSIQPPAATGQLFIHPFAVSPVNEAIMVYPAGRSIHLNVQLDQANPSTLWETMTPLTSDLPEGYRYTTLAFAPSGSKVYLASSGGSNLPPRFAVFTVSTRGTEHRLLPGVGNGWYPHNISVHPTNDNEFLLVFSNYNIAGLFHTTDGGQNYTVVEGNLTGTAQAPGPSIRSAQIVTVTGGRTEYYVGTSTGLYSTTQLNGAATVWIREANSVIGTSIIEDLAYRPADGRMAAASHGRGMFVGNVNVAASSDRMVRTDGYALAPAYPNPFNPETTIGFTLPAAERIRLAVYDLNGRLVAVAAEGAFAAGSHQMRFSGAGLASGTYLYRLESGKTMLSGRMTLLK